MTTETIDDGKITCQIDGARVHSVQLHIKAQHPEWTLERYKQEFPHAPLLSDMAKAQIEKRTKEREGEKIPVSQKLETGAAASRDRSIAKKPLHEIFELGKAAAALNARGEPIPISIFSGLDPEAAAIVPDIDKSYVFNIDLTKTVIIGLELNLPTYLWGMHGSGKTTVFEQVCARTGRPFMRVQHTVNTEEAHIVGQYVVKNGATEFQPGPLTLAMLNGHVYAADEYDFAMPSVLSVYQPVLEGKPLVIKEAPPEFRVIRPHPDFRFVATGNTNGGGDETGLYQGVQIQNAANYSRFAIVEEVLYMEKKVEVAVIVGKTGIDKRDAEKIVDFAKEIRDAFRANRIGSTVSPRELIAAARLGLVRGSDWRGGLRLGYTNRLSRTDKEVVEQFAQRIFG
ncbi:cobaltochelatase CobS [Faunimonas pinastri]|uniref:Cobaltochelatase CobS n=1 Tax=Faunimonas pinastri TaxID=1855383 RepID=A0A1H9MZE4_9HYPH|nr:MoxR family ATPase [Faunimonas pinastri]SER28897.1 cobaltochelatase CobS [Faunimonas pinastri]